MPRQLPSTERYILILQGSILFGAAIRVWASGLHRTYRYFFGYLIAAILSTVAALTTPFATNLYRNVFLTVEGVAIIFFVLIVQEVYSTVLSAFTGIASTARRYIQIAVGVAIFVSLLLLTFETVPVNLTGKMFLLDRAIMFSLLLFVLFMLVFLIYYPISLSRNVLVYSIGFAFYFLAKAGTLFVRNLGFGMDRWMSIFLLIVSNTCMVLWLIGLSRNGEKRGAVIGHFWNQEEDERLLEQLKIINANLSRTVKKK